MVSRVNHAAVVVAAVGFFILGWLWYTVLFGSTWMALAGKTSAQPVQSMGMQLLVSFLLGLALAYVIAIALSDSSSPNPSRHGVEFGIFMGIGIFGTMTLQQNVFEGRSIVLWLINTGYVVVGMCIMGAIIGAWKKKEVPASA